MYYPCIKTPAIALAVLCAAAALTLIAPKTVTAQSHLQMEKTPQGISVVCPEHHRPKLAWHPSWANLVVTDPHVGKIHVALRTQPEKMVRIELHEPETSWGAVLTEERASDTVELQVPEVLLGSLYAEGRVQMLQRRQERCIPSFSLY